MQIIQNNRKDHISKVRSPSLDTLFIDNNSPMQWSIKMKSVPLGNPLKSAQYYCPSKPLHLVNIQRSYEAVRITHTFTMGKWFDHRCFEYTLWSTLYMAALQHNVQTCTYFH